MALDGYDKAAILLTLLGEDTASEILKNLDVSDIGKITSRMTRMGKVNKEAINEVIKETTEAITRGDIKVDGKEFIKKVLSKGLGEEDASKILEMASKESPFEALKWVDPRTLSAFLMTEHPQTIALVISLLEPAQGAEVLASLPDPIKPDVAMRIATTGRIPESAIEELKEVLKGQLELGKGRGKKMGGIKTIAEILNHSDKTTEQLVIEKIEEMDDTLAESIRQLMFVFDDLVNVDDRGIQMILKEISTEDLSLALKTASEALKEKIFRNMSQRAAQILKEEMQTRGPVRVSDVEKAQQNIVKTARKLESEGKIILAGKGGEELVV